MQHRLIELAWYIWTQVGVTAGADMMFNDSKLAMKAGHHWGAPISTWNVLLERLMRNLLKTKKKKKMG